MLLTILLFTALGSIGSLFGAALLLLFPKSIRGTLLPALVSLATGSLLGTAFLRIIPESLESHKDPEIIFAWVLGGMILFFLLEKMVIWRHCHDGHHCEAHGRSSGPLILIGDGVHNFTDGFVIGAAFLQSRELGIAVALSLIAHELPQEVGDFAILLESGFSRVRSFFYNLISSTPALVGAVVAYFFLKGSEEYIPYVLAISAASFIYISTADLVPNLHKKVGLKATISQLILMGLGVFIIVVVGDHPH